MRQIIEVNIFPLKKKEAKGKKIAISVMLFWFVSLIIYKKKKRKVNLESFEIAQSFIRTLRQAIKNQRSITNP
ncbi:hypothetical protein [Flavobacterium sp. YO64]|uniref:hypothetical protein n=1 Tax=Flavobacterium sp. YO64 TaxID=394559 RepID=UPI0013E91F74|nr:hypothetical protein [Flavobacterium sp. YO64]